MHFLVQVSTSLLVESVLVLSLFLGSATRTNIDGEGNALLVEHVGDHLDLGFCCCDLLGGRGLGATLAEEEGHFWDVLWVVNCLLRESECV
jgi:hypothetical protein